MTVLDEIYRGIAVAVVLSTVFAMVVTPVLAQLADDISVAMKHTKKVTLVAIKNSSDEPVYGLKIAFEDGIRFVKTRAWDRDRIDQDTVVVMTNEYPLEPGRTLIIILIVNNKEGSFEWSALDASGKVLAGTMIESQNAVQQPKEPEPKQERGTFKPTPLSSKVTLNGAGATFPFPLIDKWRVEYAKVNDKVTINYQSIGSGGGIKQFAAKTVDFGASDAPLTREQFETLKEPIHLPETIGAVTVSYNLPGLDKKPIDAVMKLTPDIVADIFLGKIKKWNDVRIAQLNPELLLPDKGIIVVHRSDGSGTTHVFTDYLSTVSEEWKEKVGTGKAVQWPIGVGAAGNEGVASVVRSTPYSIGYVELAYATQTNMPVAALQNQEGEFILPSLESTQKAAGNAVVTLPKPWEDWSKVSIVDAPGTGSYPIASFTYILLYTNLGDIPGMTKEKGQALVDFLYWAITDGQRFSPALEYVPLPDEVVDMNIEALRRLHLNGMSFNIPS